MVKKITKRQIQKEAMQAHRERMDELRRLAKIRKNKIWIVAFFITLILISTEAFILKMVLRFFNNDILYWQAFLIATITNFLFSFIKTSVKYAKKELEKN